MRIEIGSVSCSRSSTLLNFAFFVRTDGDAYLQIYAHDPNDRKCGVVHVLLDGYKYELLKELLNRTDQTIEKVRKAGKVKPKAVDTQF